MGQAAETQNDSLEVEEPSVNSKLLQKGVHHSSETPIPFFRVKKLSDNAVSPSRGSPLSAGYDLSSATEAKVPARGKVLIPIDLRITVPEGTYARIDADYRGAVGVKLFNHSDVEFEVKKGDRIAQLIIQRIVTPHVVEVDDLEATVRGNAGFGSTAL